MKPLVKNPVQISLRDVKIGEIIIDEKDCEFKVTDIGANGIAHDGRYYHTFEELEEWGFKPKTEIQEKITESINFLKKYGYKIEKNKGSLPYDVKFELRQTLQKDKNY